MKKFLLLNTFTWLLLMYTIGQTAVAQESFTIKNDTSADNKILPTLGEGNNSKKGFKDLFENEGYTYTTGPRLNPRAVSFVEDYIEKNGKDLNEMKGWGKPYFNVMDAILISHSLPKELKYLAVIESRLHISAVSWAGAVGPWQLMPATARTLGLKVNRSIDERTNYIKSTHAAAKYLNDLYGQFGDWLLVIAAYNGGPGNVIKAIKRSGSVNFWDLQYYLPTESRNHVKKFISTHYIFEGQGGLTTLTKKETTENYGVNGLYVFNRRITTDELNNSKTQIISGKYYSLVIAKNVMMDIMDYNRYNPDFDKVMASTNSSYEIKLPADKMDLFNSNKYQILNESIQFILSSAVNTTDKPVAKDTNTINKIVKQ